MKWLRQWFRMPGKDRRDGWYFFWEERRNHQEKRVEWEARDDKQKRHIRFLEDRIHNQRRRLGPAEARVEQLEREVEELKLELQRTRTGYQCRIDELETNGWSSTLVPQLRGEVQRLAAKLKAYEPVDTDTTEARNYDPLRLGFSMQPSDAGDYYKTSGSEEWIRYGSNSPLAQVYTEALKLHGEVQVTRKGYAEVLTLLREIRALVSRSEKIRNLRVFQEWEIKLDKIQRAGD